MHVIQFDFVTSNSRLATYKLHGNFLNFSETQCVLMKIIIVPSSQGFKRTKCDDAY